MRIDSSGNLGIGRTPVNKLDIGTSFTSQSSTGINASSKSVRISNSEAGVLFTTDINTAGSSSGTQTSSAQVGYTYFSSTYPTDFVIGTNTQTVASNLRFYNNNAEVMRIDASGNLGIGSSSITGIGANVTTLKIAGRNTSNAGGIQLYSSDDTTVKARTWAETGGWYFDLQTAQPMIFSTSGTERMRITSGGEVYVAGTTDRGAFNLQCNGTGVWGAGAYTNGSDKRIKNNVKPLATGLDVVAKLNPVTYKYNEDWSKDQSTQTGFIAQELLIALDGKDYVDGIVNQSSEYMSVAYQNIIPILTKAIQEQQALIASLTARLDAAGIA
jgi:hypothetical protein